MRILGWVLFFCAVTLIAGCSREPGVRAPNVLLLSLDTLRADHLGSYGYSRNTSPFLDELAREGVRFSNAFINCHPTPPSHVSILSSTYQETHKLFTNRDVSLIRSVPVEIPMLQEMLHSHGYTTLAVTGGGFTSSSIGFDRGFDEFSEDAGFDRLLELLEEESGDGSPIFAFVHTYEIHAPYAPPDRYRDLFGQFDSRFNPTARNLLDIHADASPLTPQDLELIRARYDGGIRFTDDLLRGLFSELKSSGFLENAIVVVTSDHGEEFGEHGGLLHGGGKLYDELLRVPLIIAGGGLPEGQVIDRLVSSVDIAPTILALAGIERGSLMVGRNLIDPMPSTEPEVVFSQWEDRYYSVRTRDWKLITDTKGVSDDELYHVAQDPAESDSVADQFPDRVDAMQQVLASWKEALDTSVQPGAEIELDETTLERLRSLGYLR